MDNTNGDILIKVKGMAAKARGRARVEKGKDDQRDRE